MGLPLGLHRTLTPTSVSQLREKAGRGHHLTGGDTRSLSASPRKGVSDNRSRPQGLGSSSSALSLPSAVGETVETGQKRGAGRLGEGRSSTRGATCSRQGSGPQRATWAQRPSSEPVNYMGIILGPTYHAPAWVPPLHPLTASSPSEKAPTAGEIAHAETVSQAAREQALLLSMVILQFGMQNHLPRHTESGQDGCARAGRQFCLPSKATQTLAVTGMGEPQLLRLQDRTGGLIISNIYEVLTTCQAFC